MPRRVLLFCEGASLAHVARPLALLDWLPDADFDVSIACPGEFSWALGEHKTKWVPLQCQSSAEFARRLAQGRVVFDESTLTRYVEDDLRLISEYRPDLVIGDFRLSLGVSARRAGVPYIALSDAYWSEGGIASPPLPVLPASRWFSLPVYQALFRLAWPLAMRLHAAPMARVRKKYGLPTRRADLSSTYQDADYIAFANFSRLFPDVLACHRCFFIGPMLWSIPVGRPPWWNELPSRDACVFISLGSSGAVQGLETIVDQVVALGKTAVVATAGRSALEHAPGHSVFVADFLPGKAACEAASCAVTNGGSPMSQLGLSSGVPVLGVPTNLDQFLCMRAFERVGAGCVVRADRCTPKAVRGALSRLLEEPKYAASAKHFFAGEPDQEGKVAFDAALTRCVGGPVR